MVGEIKYTHENGYTGILYGESSLAIYDKTGKMKMHTGSRNINTREELIDLLDNYPSFLEAMDKIAEDLKKRKIAMTCPCKDCENRHLKCHGDCQAYIEWKQEKNHINELKREEYGYLEYQKVRAKKRRRSRR